MSGSGKTSFLRLLLDTSLISPRTTKDQLASVAKFVQGCTGHTSYIRSASIDINVDVDGNGQLHPLGLTLIDTPSFDFKDEVAAERLLADILRQVDSRFVEGIDDVRRLFAPISVISADHINFTAQEWKAQTGDRYIHLCVVSPFISPHSTFLVYPGVSTSWIRTKLYHHLSRDHLHRLFPVNAPVAFPSRTTNPSSSSLLSPPTHSLPGRPCPRQTLLPSVACLHVSMSFQSSQKQISYPMIDWPPLSWLYAGILRMPVLVLVSLMSTLPWRTRMKM
jgi:hypothetical protein